MMTLKPLDCQEFAWLNLQRCGDGRATILAELGRISDRDQMIRLAREVCRERPTARRAIAHLRRHRTGVNPNPRERLALRTHRAVFVVRY